MTVLLVPKGPTCSKISESPKWVSGRNLAESISVKILSFGDETSIRLLGQYAVIREAVLTNIHRQTREKTE